MFKVHKAWDGNHRWVSTPTSLFSIKPVPICERKKLLVLWLFWPKTSVCGVVDRCCTSQGQYYFIRKVHEACDGNHGYISSPASQFATKPIPVLEENRQIVLLFWPKINVCKYGCRLVLYHLNLNISLVSRFVKPGMGIIDGFLLQPYHFLSSQSPLLREID